MGLKGKLEALIYAAEEPITLEQLAFLMKEPVLQELSVEQQSAAAEAIERAAQEAAEREQYPEQAGIEVVEELLTEPVAEPTEEQAEPDAPTQEPPAAEETSAPIPEEAAAEAEVPASAPEETAADTETLPAADASANETPESSATPSDEFAAEAAEKAKPAVLPKRKKYDFPPEVKVRVRALIQELVEDYANNDRGMDIRHVAGGYRMATKPEHHDIVKAFAKSLKPPLRLSLPALETLAVVAYKQPVTAPEVSEIRGVDSQGVMATLLERKLVTTAGRKAVIGRPILYKTTKEFLMRFGMNDVSELPSMEEFEKLAQEQSGLFIAEGETEPALSPEEASALLEQASAAVEENSEAGSEVSDEATEDSLQEAASDAPEAETVTPETEAQIDAPATEVAAEETNQD